MLWYKGWLETRFKVALILGVAALILGLQSSMGIHPSAVAAKNAVVANVSFSVPIFIITIAATLAGAGIATQPSLQATKGLHGSTLFTLSLPVSRLRLLAVRAMIGWIEGAALISLFCCLVWLRSSPLRAIATIPQMVEYAGTLFAAASALYFFSVLLATFLDDQWRVWGTMIGAAFLWWLPAHTPLPAFVDLFGAMGKGSPLIAHTIPWAQMIFSLVMAAVLFFAALKVAQRREY